MDHPQLLTQLARLTGDDRLPFLPPQALNQAIESTFPNLVDGLLGETAASDDVVDRSSALLYLEDRLASFSGLLGEDLTARLRAALEERVSSW